MRPELQEQIRSWTPDPARGPRDEDWFPPVFEDAPFGIAAIDMVGNFVRVNRACARLHGRSQEEMIGMHALSMHGDPAQTAQHEQVFELGKAGEIPRYEVEHHIRRPDGALAWALVTATALRDADGAPIYVLLEYHETTGAHEIADEARSSTEAFQLTFDTAPLAIASFDLEGHVLEWNPRAEAVFGWRAEEVVGLQLPMIPPERHEAALKTIDRLVEDETIPAGETVLRHRDGHDVHAVVTASVMHTAEGAPERIVAFCLDVTRQRETEKELRTSETWLRTIFAKTSDTVTVVGPDGRIVFAAAEHYEILGYDQEFWHQRNIFDLVHPDEIDRAAELWDHLLEDPDAEIDDVFRIRRADGGFDTVEVLAVNMLDDPEIGGVVVTTRFLSELRRTRELLGDEARILEMVACDAPLDETLGRIAEMVERNSDGGHTGIVLLDRDGHMTVGAAPNLPEPVCAEVEGHEPFGLFARSLARGETVLVTDTTLDPRIDEHAAFVTASGMQSGWLTPIMSSGTGEALGLIATYFDEPDVEADRAMEIATLAAHVSAIAIERSRTHEELHHQAHHDELTGLPNRTQIVKQLEQMLHAAQSTGGDVAVMFIDLDRFKVINDSLGHRAGDNLLRMFAERVHSLTRPGDLVGRFSADEFVMLVCGTDAEAAVHAVANRIELSLDEPFPLEGGDIYLSVSMGVAQAGFEETTALRLIEQASAAMVQAKRQGRDRLEVFDHRMRTKARERLQLEHDLRLAVERQEFVLHYQPKVDLSTGALIGAEALLRWQHPERGLVLPGQFIPLAEETGLIVRIGRWVLEEAVSQARRWADEIADVEHFLMAVNFSARQLGAPDVINNLARVLLKYEWHPQQLSVELTESILIDDAEGSLEVVKQLKNLGVQLTIDDFGTGYSSLSYLHRFPVDIVKIDRAFVSELQPDGTGGAVATAIMHMSEALGMVTSAEGVETGDQLRGLRRLGCRWAQGFLFSHAIPAERFRDLLTAADGFDVGA